MKRFFILVSALLALPVSAARTGHAVYRPGLTQARIPLGSDMGYKTAYTGVPNLASNLLATADAAWLDRTLGVFKDGGNANDAVNPVSGKAWPWLVESGHGVFAYEGQMFVEAGTTYSFYGRNYNGEALVLDGATLVHQGPRNAWNYAPEVFGAWTPAKTGWVDFNAWLWSFNGSIGPVGDKCAWGLQWNPDGIVPEQAETTEVFALARDTEVWSRFADPGNGTFFRTVTGERFTTVGASEPVSGGRSYSLSFAGVPASARLVAFSGPSDGLHATGTWSSVSAVLATVPQGDSTATVTVPLAADSKILRFRLEHFDAASTSGLDNFEEWSEALPATPEPVPLLESVAPGYTNVVVSGLLETFGIGGASATVTVEVAAAADAAFADPVASVALPPASVLGAFTAEVSGLSTNAAYLVRATAVNDGEVTGHSAVVPFSTKAPAPPAASLAVAVAGFQSATLAATVSDWGGGSAGVEVRADVSEDESFPAGTTKSLSLGSLSGAAPATATGKIEGLAPDTPHFARVRVVNSWGLETVSETVAFRTSDVPIGLRPPEATADKGRVSVTLAPSYVAPGTVYDVTIGKTGFDGTLFERLNQTGYGPFVYSALSAAGVEVEFVCTIRWTYGERSGTIETKVTTAAKLADIAIDALPKIDPAYDDGDWHGVYLRPGVTVAVTPSAGATIDWHTNAVLSVTPTNGVFLLEALEPGAALLYETDLATGETNNVTGVAIVLPAEDPEGGIYVRRTLADFVWTDPAAWEMVAEGPQGYPDAAGAWVFIATPTTGTGGPDLKIQIGQPVTIGDLAVGQLGWIHHTKSLKSHWAWIFADDAGDGGAIAFDSGDGSESRILTLGHAYNVSRVMFQVPVSTANDLAVDELWRVQDTLGWKNTWDLGLGFWAPVDLGTNTLRNIRGNLYRYAPTKIWSSFEGNGCGARGFLQFYGDIRGSGTIRLEADSMVGCVQGEVRDLSFTGTWDVANGQNVSCYGGSGFTWPGTSLGRSREMIVRGSWLRADLFWPGGAFARSAEEGSNWHMFQGWTNDWRSVLPPKLTLDGGCLYLHPNYLGDGWTQYENDPERKRRILYDVDTLEIPSGPMGFLSVKKSESGLRYPDQHLTVTNLAMEPGAVLALEVSDSAVNKTNEIVIVNEPDGWADPADPNRQFLPGFFANQQRLSNPQYRESKPYVVAEAAVDNTYLFFRDGATGRVTREQPAATGNGYRRWTEGETLADGARYYSMQLASNVTNAFAAGATVRNLAGYLDMRKGAALGRPGEDAGSTLDFGDRPARVFVGNWDEVAAIGCRLAGSAGLVKGGSGVLALGASAAGVSGGVRVAGGTLALGAPDAKGNVAPGRLAGDVHVEAGSRLVVRDRGNFAPGARLFLNDRPWIPSVGHVRVEAGGASVVKLFIAGEPMPNGYYGSSESGAENADDVHFEGPGILWAGVRPAMLILR